MMQKNRLLKILLAGVAFLSVVLLVYSLCIETSDKPKNTLLKEVLFTGVYWTQQNSTPATFTRDTHLDASRDEKVVFQGKLNCEFASGQTLMLRLQNIRARVYLNNELVYEHGKPGTFPSISRSPGNLWTIFVTPKITLNDTVRIELENIYKNNPKNSYDLFINHLVMGDSGVLLHVLMQRVGASFQLGGTVMILGSVLLGTLLLLKLQKAKISSKLMYFSLCTISVGTWFFFDFQLISLLIPYGVFNNIVSMLSLSLIMPLFSLYTLKFLDEQTGNPIWISACIQLGFTAFYLMTQMLGIFDAFDLIYLQLILMGLGLLLLWIVLVRANYKKRNGDVRFLLVSCSAIFFSAGDIHTFFMGKAPTYQLSKLSFLLFILIQFVYVLRCVYRGVDLIGKSKKLETELAQSRIAIAVSQIQPHFLYNSLTAIKQLCVEDPVRAEKSVGAFASFLRGNIDSLSGRAPILFTRELNHIKNYLALEQLRFGERLRVCYEIETDDFFLPSLIVQPLVENAVRYGITKKAGGGTVTISVREDDKDIIITVTDDGVGFDCTHLPDDGRTHIGISNVRKRLTAQCKGTLFIHSTVGQGTRAVITFKKGWLSA